MASRTKKRKKIHTNTTIIRRLMDKLQINDALQLSLETAEERLDEPRRDYRKARKQAVKWREDFLDKLADDLAEKLDIEKEAAIKKLKSKEKMRRIFRKLRYLKKAKRKTRDHVIYFGGWSPEGGS